MSNEAKFTKGDWFVNPTGPHWNNPEVASYEICWSEDKECVVDHVYELADAHLIASAPDMYNELQEVSNWLNSQLGMGDWHREIENLLSKARGEYDIN